MVPGEVLGFELRRLAAAGVTTPCQVEDPSRPDRFFEGTVDELAAVAEECRGCPVIGLCAAAADYSDKRFGIWAGRNRTRYPVKRVWVAS